MLPRGAQINNFALVAHLTQAQPHVNPTQARHQNVKQIEVKALLLRAVKQTLARSKPANAQADFGMLRAVGVQQRGDMRQLRFVIVA